jgi:hypothetical protein
MNKESSMPARRALRTLTLGFDLAVFIWRRYGSISQRSAPATDAPPMEPVDHQRVISVAEDNDADATEGEDGDTEDHSPERTQTINFGLDGQNYAIDLTDQSAAELRQTLDRYIAVGRPVSRQTRTAKIAAARPRAGQLAPADGQDAAAIRQWARAHGHRISDRGPIPATVRQAYAAQRRRRAG